MVATRATERNRPVSPSWTRRRRLLVSVCVTLHLAAVFFPPFTFQTSPIRGLGSPFAELVMSWLQPYCDFAYLNHGYAFFAPDPGPSHLLRARLRFADGRDAVVLTYPDLQKHWPRLRYHRHFMLAEHLHDDFVPPEPPPEIAQDPRELRAWQRARAYYRARLEAMKAHLRTRYGACNVELVRVEHRLLEPFEKMSLGKSLDDSDTYLELTDESPREMPR